MDERIDIPKHIWYKIKWINEKRGIKSIERMSPFWNNKYLKKERILKQSNDNHGYLQCHIWRIHRLVALTFIPNPDNKRCINHKNWKKTDNRLENLERCTHSENTQHSFDVLLRERKTYDSSRKIIQKDLQWNIIKSWNSITESCIQFWYKAWHICNVCRWKYKTAYGYIREYVK